jgi:hypothetical protein
MQTTASPLKPVSSPVNVTTGNKEHHVRNEQSLDYVIRSGIAGGFAGCIVSNKINWFILLLKNLLKKG